MTKQSTSPLFPVNRVTNPSADFVQALQEDSNREDDWLYWASKVTARDEQMYCLERARYINPHSVEAAHGLHRLSRMAQPPKRPTPIARLRGLVFGRYEA